MGQSERGEGRDQVRRGLQEDSSPVAAAGVSEDGRRPAAVAAGRAGHYTPDYFADQLKKSDAKVAWQYGTLARLAGLTTGKLRVLDAGCGAGPGLRYLAGTGNFVVGADLVLYALQQAGAVVPGSLLVNADLKDGLPFSKGSFDVILLSDVIEHVDQTGALLAECHRVLAPGGTLIVATVNNWDLRRFIFPLIGRVWSGRADPTHVRLFSPGLLSRCLASSGFRVKRIKTGYKPLYWISSSALGIRIGVPWPPLVGNGLVGIGMRPGGN